jgi:polysaccharide biosynthesis/export protein
MRTLTIVMFVLALSSTGCSTLGLSLWPGQFPLLSQTKEFAARAPLPNGLPNELSKQVLGEYFLEPGDRILIEPLKLDSDFRAVGDQRIHVDGSVDLGEYGRVRVAGLTVEAVESLIQDRIVEVGGTREAINVQLVETNAAKVYVLGEVGSPGAYTLDGNETVLDAILRAGGLTTRASPCDMILVRPTHACDCRVVLPVCYRQITQLGDVSTNYQLQPGDRIVVGTRSLCEELSVWKQKQGCERCCQSRCVECRPETVQYKNRIVGILSAFPLPFKETKAASAAENVQNPPAATTNLPLNGNNSSRRLESDKDIFLPPQTPVSPDNAVLPNAN